MSLRAVLFDLDDTLHDKSANLRTFAAAQYGRSGLRALGVAAQPWQAEYVALNNLRIAKTEVFERLGSMFHLAPSLSRSLREEFDADSGHTTAPYPGVHQLLRLLRESGIKLGIVTNGRDRFQRGKIEGMGIGGMVDVVLTSGGFGVKKPDLRIFLACLSALEVEPADATVVGDDLAADIEPALALGMRAVWKSPRHSSRATFCSDSIDEICAYLLQPGPALHRPEAQR